MCGEHRCSCAVRAGHRADDTRARFILILIPAGPSAMVLANLAEYVDTDQGPIAGYLTVAVSAFPES